jgi:predicted small secreted protein
MGAEMMRVIAIIMACFLLQGCATLTIAGIGAAVAIGVASGAGRFAGERIARSGWKRHIAYKRCHHLQYDYYLLEQCVRRYVRR